MKLAFTLALMGCLILGNSVASDVVDMPPAATQKEASLWTARVVDRYRYKPEGWPDGTGTRPFDRFVEDLDPEHMVFTKADLAGMASQRAQLDKLTDDKQMEIPNAIFATYLANSIALNAYAREVLRQPLDFYGHERFQRVRSKAIWEADEAALHDLWRRRVTDDYLNLRLIGAQEAQIVATLRRRYDHILHRVQAMRSDDIANLFLNAYVASFDPHGAYLGLPRPTSGRNHGAMVGTGVVLQKKEDLVTVLEVAPGSPADRNGDIGPGDRILGVAQDVGQPMTNVIGWRVEDVVELLRGAPGSQVILDILPQGVTRDSTPRRVVLTHAEIQVEEHQRAKGRVELIQHGAIAFKIGVIAVPMFYQDFAARKAGAKDYESVTRDVAAVLEQMKAQKADAILLDMRNNGGGSLTEAIELTGLFLPGVPVAQQFTYDRKLTIETAPQGTAAWDGPLAILINRKSAAAIEITAAAIQDYGRGLVIGDSSYGRGSVQTIVNLSRFAKDPSKQLGELKLTIAVLCRAGGKPIQPAGVTPDIVVPGRLDVTGKANADLFPGPACNKQDIPNSANLDALLPTLSKLHDSRMQGNRSYQAQLIRRAREEALLSSDEVTLNEAERRRTLDVGSDADIAQLQLTETLKVVSDVVDQMRKRSSQAAGTL